MLSRYDGETQEIEVVLFEDEGAVIVKRHAGETRAHENDIGGNTRHRERVWGVQGFLQGGRGQTH